MSEQRPAVRPAVRLAAARDAVVCLAWFAVAGVLGALAWWWLTPTVTATQTEGGPALEPSQLQLQVALDGWFGAVALTGSILSGLALLTWRRQRPELMVVLVTLGGGVAALLMLKVGALLGPTDPAEVLAGAEVGAQAPLDLRLQASGMAWLWPAGAAFGALVQLLVLRRPDSEPAAPLPDSASAPVEPR